MRTQWGKRNNENTSHPSSSYGSGGYGVHEPYAEKKTRDSSARHHSSRRLDVVDNSMFKPWKETQYK
ncbi:MAG: hypothetical protein AB7O96_03105 [Pseudobdellovibrionaceae bacterium]